MKDTWRLKVGDFRVVLRFTEVPGVLVAAVVPHRREAYHYFS